MYSSTSISYSFWRSLSAYSISKQILNNDSRNSLIVQRSNYTHRTRAYDLVLKFSIFQPKIWFIKWWATWNLTEKQQYSSELCMTSDNHWDCTAWNDSNHAQRQTNYSSNSALILKNTAESTYSSSIFSIFRLQNQLSKSVFDNSIPIDNNRGKFYKREVRGMKLHQ